MKTVVKQITQYKAWSDVPKNLVSKTALRNQGLNPGAVRATVYQRMGRRIIDLYDINEAVPRKAPTEKQLLAIQKARAAFIALCTCNQCGQVFNYKLANGISKFCKWAQWLERVSTDMLDVMCGWIQNKEQYVILDTETTGLESDAEIIELAIIDLDENILFDSLIKPKNPVSIDAAAFHSITNDMLIGVPSWLDVWPKIESILRRKTVLIYNESFDIRLIQLSCVRNGIP